MNPSRFGWYLQQFLKLSALQKFNQEPVIIWDADSVALNPISFFRPDGGIEIYTSDEYHLPYFELIDRLLRMDKRVPFSFIAQCLPVPAGWGGLA